MSERDDEILRRVNELARGWLRNANEWWPDGFDVDEIGVAWAVSYPDDTATVSLSCTDGRDWVKSGLFRAAMQLADEPAEPEGADNAKPS